ncbi:MAG: DsbA family protein [Bdellovibrio sp.]|nr:DsbA family protein [Bdellovibrio sp.]
MISSGQNNNICDLDTGVCEAPILSSDTSAAQKKASNLEIVYIGDPMCSWCWGISSVVKQLQSYCDEQGLSFSVVVGGLRPGGGDPWNDQFKNFLRHHWEEIGQRTGQAFRFSLFERSHFNYDTEPACRAVVTAGILLNSKNDNNKTLYALFADIQKKFYVDNADPGEEEFYRSICEEYGLSFEEFRRIFQAPETKKKTFEEFQRNRSWGVRGYPSFGLLKDGKFELLAVGFTDFERLKERLNILI